MMNCAPLPMAAPPIEIDRRNPFFVLLKSFTAGRIELSRVAKAR